ncbi:hypothetical protein UP06_23210 [Bradyrhizobium sp. LTSP857]|nr:hypothetical protein UP06_23210 [Bradyrhizobium sp. LTSP857]
MGTIVSPWRYDAAAREASRPDNLRRTTIFRYALMAAAFPIFAGGPVILRWRRFSINPGNGAMCQIRTYELSMWYDLLAE